MTRGVYRRTDRGQRQGNEPRQLKEFFGNMLGEGEKTIGGEHENFGVGAKTSLLPWNKFGVVIVSWTKDCPEGSLIHILLRSEIEGIWSSEIRNRRLRPLVVEPNSKTI